VGRGFFAWLLAPAFGGATGGAAAAPLMIVAMIGILAAIAIPNFIRYQERAKAAAAARAEAHEAVAVASAAPAPSPALTQEQLESLEWVRQVRLQMEARQKAAAQQSPPR
jgi:hypothetical protein